MNISKAWRSVYNNRVSGKAADIAVEPTDAGLVPVCHRKRCYRPLGHDKGLHGYTQGTGVRRRVRPGR